MKNLCFAILVSLTLAALSPIPAQAEKKIAPADVFRVASEMERVLLKLHQANLSTPKVEAVAARIVQPRHVYFKVRQIFMQVQKLRAINGLSEHTMTPLRSSKIRPREVLALLRSAMRDLRDLSPVFGVEASTQAEDRKVSTAMYVGKKTSEDVYTQLARVSTLVEQLGLCAVLPNQVFAESSALYEDILAIAKYEGMQVVPALPEAKERVGPSDVYEASVQLMAQLKIVCEQLGSACPEGGISLPRRPSGAIVPASVLEVLLVGRADAHALRVNLTGTQEMKEQHRAAGKSPSHVQQSLAHSRDVLTAILGRLGRR